jgi:hypothetical protein
MSLYFCLNALPAGGHLCDERRFPLLYKVEPAKAR